MALDARVGGAGNFGNAGDERARRPPYLRGSRAFPSRLRSIALPRARRGGGGAPRQRPPMRLPAGAWLAGPAGSDRRSPCAAPWGRREGRQRRGRTGVQAADVPGPASRSARCSPTRSTMSSARADMRPRRRRCVGRFNRRLPPDPRCGGTQAPAAPGRQHTRGVWDCIGWDSTRPPRPF